jgi:hypothetical protein
MFARVTTFEDVDLSLEREALAWTSTEGRRISRAIPGYRGLLTLLDRDDRRLLGIGFYGSSDDAWQADRLLRALRPESMPEELRRAIPTRALLGVFEIVAQDGIRHVSPEERFERGTE